MGRADSLLPPERPGRCSTSASADEHTDGTGASAEYCAEDARRHSRWRPGDAARLDTRSRRPVRLLQRVPEAADAPTAHWSGLRAIAPITAFFDGGGLPRRDELIEFGPYNQPPDPRRDLYQEQVEEIAGSKSRIEELTEKAVASFSYPFGRKGDYTRQTVSLVRSAGFACACSNSPGAVGSRSDRWQLPRIYVEDWDAEEFAQVLTA
ncbi:MAG: polysaccharide deacetylase family protein, partial [Chloroflexia bacterium]